MRARMCYTMRTRMCYTMRGTNAEKWENGCMKEISILDVARVRIGQAENAEAGTGVTVVVSEEGMPAGLDVRGGGPASRESQLLNPLMNAQTIHAVVLSGGSAFGLDAAGGVQRYLEERGIGYDVGVTRVPIVCQASLFDLTVGSSSVRPDQEMGYRACVNAETNNYRDGNFGAGTGATVGKLEAVRRSMKAGMGSFAVQIGGLKVGAIVALNAYGDIFDPETGKQIAGLRSEDGKSLASTSERMYQAADKVKNRFVSAAVTANTTLGIVITNAAFAKPQLCKIAGMAHDGFARAIRPVHTSVDGDSIFAVSAGKVEADLDMVGSLSADVMAKAILNAVRHAESAYGLPSWKELFGQE